MRESLQKAFHPTIPDAQGVRYPSNNPLPGVASCAISTHILYPRPLIYTYRFSGRANLASVCST